MSGEMERLQRENAYLKRLITKMLHRDDRLPKKIVSKLSPLEQKVALFKDLFQGRQDLYALYWESKNGKRGYSPACAVEWQSSKRQSRQLLPFTDQVIMEQLEGKKDIGIYPLFPNGTCHFLAVDFDGAQWKNDVLLFMDSCQKVSIEASIERSRSGKGAHVWIFFDEPIQAKIARELGMFLLTETKARNSGFNLSSFDRLFPNQDVLPKGGFGNLIALPLHKQGAQMGNRLFVDREFKEYPDQWLYLSTLRKVSIIEIQKLIKSENDIKEEKRVYSTRKVHVEVKNGLHISKADLSQELIAEIEALATFRNPEYYKAKAARLSTHTIPSLIHCADELGGKLILPRGCSDILDKTLKEKGIEMKVIDSTSNGEGIHVEFLGKLSMQQDQVLETLLKYEQGTLVATTGFGKTVVATALIAKRNVNTLIIVHRKQLMDQWVEKLVAFLNVSPEDIGRIGGGKNRITGKIDVTTIQSLTHGGQLKSFITQYGQVIVDECHSIAAFTFERVLKQIRTKYVLGLTATPKRRDGLDPIVTMQCGPIRYTIDAKSQALVRPFVHVLMKRATIFKTTATKKHVIFDEMTVDVARNELIFNDVLNALEEGRSPIILTERVAHVKLLAEMLQGFAKNIIVLTGEMTNKEREKAFQRIEEISPQEERLLIATGKYIGEGFDDQRLDTLFLTMPIAWKGTLQQYVGRLHREYDNKSEVRVYDYVDVKVPSLCKKYEKRLKGYKESGYVLRNDAEEKSEQMRLF